MGNEASHLKDPVSEPPGGLVQRHAKEELTEDVRDGAPGNLHAGVMRAVMLLPSWSVLLKVGEV